MNALFGQSVLAVLCFTAAPVISAAPPSQQGPSTEVICSYAPSQSPAVTRISGVFGGAGAGVAAIMAATGLQAVLHSSGLYILTSSGGYIAGTLGGAVVAPIVITTSVIIAGGAVALELTCIPRNHPDALKKVKEAGEAFKQQVEASSGKLDDLQKAAVKAVVSLNSDAIDVRDAAGKKIRSANNFAIDYRDAALGYFNK